MGKGTTRIQQVVLRILRTILPQVPLNKLGSLKNIDMMTKSSYELQSDSDDAKELTSIDDIEEAASAVVDYCLEIIAMG